MTLRSHARDSLSVIRTLELDELRDQLAHSPRLLVIAADRQRGGQFAAALTGAETPNTVAESATPTVMTPDALDGLQVGPVPYDAVLLLDPSMSVQRHPAVRQLITAQSYTVVMTIATDAGAAIDPGIPTITVTDPTDPKALAAVRMRLIPLLHPDRRIAWGHAFPGFRQPMTNHLIEQTARANAQFAIFADLTGYIPLIGGVTGASADFLVLTKNQLILAYQLAAMNGRDLSDRKLVLANSAPYLLAGLGWRELANRAARVLPGPPIVSKAVIAYGGTVIAGAVARSLADPEAVRAWLKGVERGTKTSLGVGNTRMQQAKDRIGAWVGTVEDRFGNRTHLTPKWQRDAKPRLESGPPVHVIPAAD